MRVPDQHRKRTLSSLVLALLLLAGCSGDDAVGPENESTTIQGAVVSEEGGPYPGVTVTLHRADPEADLTRRTSPLEGSYEFIRLSAGSYEVAIEPPRASEVDGANPAAVTVAEGATVQADFKIQPLPVEASVVHGENGVDLQSVRNASGLKPTHPDEPLYNASNPAALQPITAPDGHHVTLGEWRQARGTGRATCNGNSGTHYTLTLEGLIPGGVYSIGVVLVDFTTNTPVRKGTGVLGPVDGSKNVFTASGSGKGMLAVTAPPGPMSLNGSAPECALIQVSSVTLWVFYHVDGQTSSSQRTPGQVEHMRFSF